MIVPAESVEKIARVVHEALRAWAAANDQPSYPHWNRAPKWMKESTRSSVRFVLENPKAGAGAQHEQWMMERKSQGWRYGPTKDADTKTHPMLIPFSKLPQVERLKDDLVISIVKALS